MTRKLNFFHGTMAHLQVGEHIVPAVQHGKGSVWGTFGDSMGQSSEEHAYATTDREQADWFADKASRTVDNGIMGHVYPVEPVEPPRKGAYYSSIKEYLAPAWKVTGPPQYSEPPKKGHYKEDPLPFRKEPLIRDAQRAYDRAPDKAYRDFRDNPTDENQATWRALYRESLGKHRDLYNKIGATPNKKLKPRQFNEAAPKEKKTPQVKGQMTLF
jgi:hypothetical protein